MEAILELLNRTPPVTLWHYTDGNGFLGIIQNQEMWATHIRFMNDRMEQKLALEILRQRIPNILSSIVSQHCNLIQNIIETVNKEILSQDIFILSFSKKKDDLNQWRGYGNKIPSYSLGIKTSDFTEKADLKNGLKGLKKLLSNTFDFPQTEMLRYMLPVIYERNEQEKFIDDLLKDCRSNYKNHQNINELCREIANRFILLSPFIKHESSIDEKEWRVVTIYGRKFKDSAIQNKIIETQNKLEQTHDDGKKQWYEEHLDNLNKQKEILDTESNLFGFRMGSSYIIPFYKFPISNKCFSKFIIGACPDKESVEESTRYFLSRNGFTDNQIAQMLHHTKLPYRNW